MSQQLDSTQVPEVPATTEYRQMIVNPINHRAVKVGGKAHKALVKSGKLPESTLPVKKVTEKQLEALTKAREALAMKKAAALAKSIDEGLEASRTKA